MDPFITIIAFVALIVSLSMRQITTIAALEAEIASSPDIIVGHAVAGGATVEWHKMAASDIATFQNYGQEMDSSYNPANAATVPGPVGDWLEHLDVQ